MQSQTESLRRELAEHEDLETGNMGNHHTVGIIDSFHQFLYAPHASRLLVLFTLISFRSRGI